MLRLALGGVSRKARDSTATALPYCLLVMCLAATGCGFERVDGQAMGTTFSIQGQCSELPGESVVAVIEATDRLMTTYDERSDVMRLNRAVVGEWVVVDRSVVKVLDLAHEVSLLTDGAFDVTAGLVSARLGFGAANDLDGYVRGSFRDIETRIEDNRAFARRTRHVMVDLSAIAKGYAIDRVVEILRSVCSSALVEMGGEVRGFGASAERPWRVAIESTEADDRTTPTVYELIEGALATSGQYRQRRTVRRTNDPRDDLEVTHIVDQNDLALVGDVAQITVAARSAAVADALATALFAMRGSAENLARGVGVPARFVASGRAADAIEVSGFRSLATQCDERRAPALWCRP